MSSMKKTKEGVNLKKCLRLKNTGSIFVIAGLLTILVIASYTYILQSSYTKTTLETEITRDTASADAVHKLVNGKIGKEDFDQIKDRSDEKEQPLGFQKKSGGCFYFEGGVRYERNRLQRSTLRENESRAGQIPLAFLYLI